MDPMFGSALRVLSGFVLACLAAGLAKVLFTFTPMELADMEPQAAANRILLALPLGTHIAYFAAPFTLLAVALGEWRGWRDWSYYVICGIAIALAGFAALYSGEPIGQRWSITDSNYPFTAFLGTGFVGGLVYWFVSGRFAAGGLPARDEVHIPVPGRHHTGDAAKHGSKPAGDSVLPVQKH
jgi:hypothetical protein